MKPIYSLSLKSSLELQVFVKIKKWLVIRYSLDDAYNAFNSISADTTSIAFCQRVIGGAR